VCFLPVGLPHDGAVAVGSGDGRANLAQVTQRGGPGVAEAVANAAGHCCQSGSDGSNELGRAGRVAAVVADLEHVCLETMAASGQQAPLGGMLGVASEQCVSIAHADP
jgi:hypothetical protein